MDNDIQALPCNGNHDSFPRGTSRLQLALSNDADQPPQQGSPTARVLRSDWNQLSEFNARLEGAQTPPPVVPHRLLRNVWNCERLDGILEVQWKVQEGNFVTITLKVALTELPDRAGSYVAFGVSGSKTTPSMVGSDVRQHKYTKNKSELKVARIFIQI